MEVAPPPQKATGGLPRGQGERVQMRTYRLTVRPSRTAPGTYNAYLAHGHLLLERTRTPLLSGARKLLEQGASREDLVEMWWEGGASWALRSRVGRAAELTVTEESRGTTKFALWRKWPH